ncbi:MAG: hypothetical protein HRU41_24360 [Saprospiraceae bacterium]|nr:hypothetical protein [Saprospiraceae bacterium]
MAEVEYIDLSDRINAIVYKNGQMARCPQQYEERRIEANHIWGFRNFYGGNGAVIPDEEIRVGKDYKGYVEIRVAEGGNGLWAMTTVYMLPNQGASSAISVFERIGFKSKDDAILAGVIKLQNILKRISEKDNIYEADKEMARCLIQLLEELKMPQLDLF